MAKETHNEVAVAASGATSGGSSARACGRSSFLGSLFSFISMVLWPTLRKSVFTPVAIFVLAVYSALDKYLTSKKHSFMCAAHQLAVKISRARASRLAGVVLLSGIVAFLFTSAFYGFGIEVIIDGESLGYVMSQDEYIETLTRVESRVSKIMGDKYSVSPNVTFSFGVVSRDQILTDEKLEKVLYSKVEGLQQLYAISVDGNIIGACKNKAEANRALSLLTVSDNENITREIAADVSVSYEAVDASVLCTAEELADRMSHREPKQVSHVIVKGETASGICEDFGMTRTELSQLNPDMNLSRLKAGQELIVLKSSPLVSIREKQHVTETVSIPFTTKEVKDSSLYVGKKSVKTNGVAGSKQVVSDVTYVDGEITDRVVLEETVINEPVTKVVLVGTKPLPKKASTGTFRRPTGPATLSSDYGYRRSGFHTGVDFALKQGSPVYASDGGTVSFSGWKGGYGYLVIINHDNGMQTYYAHNSKLLVSRGTKVAKGEQIAKVGSTGNSTGPHVHFEIRVNGKHVNPWRYID